MRLENEWEGVWFLGFLVDWVVVEGHRGDGMGFLLRDVRDGERVRLARDRGWVGQPVGL